MACLPLSFIMLNFNSIKVRLKLDKGMQALANV